MSPFVAPGSPAPRTAPHGVAQHAAEAAYWKEKMYFGSSFLNNIRQPGTRETYYSAKKFLARQMRMLRNRCDRRKEWMVCKMLTAGSFDYIDPNNKKVSVDYGIPTDHIQQLTADRKWDQDTANIAKNQLWEFDISTRQWIDITQSPEQSPPATTDAVFEYIVKK